ncbi:MAG: hypothetical protein JKY27_09035, partial [Magnetovibrio sp.]|nr:hypothetical protein [Magnetovibrio sp.]
VVDLPAGFEFDVTSVTATVAASITGDITACTFAYTTASKITVTLTTDGSENSFDTIKFDNFEIYALASGSSGDVMRNGSGDFKISGSTDCPGNGGSEPLESMGFLLADLPMIYDSSEVSQISISDIHTPCPLDKQILEIRVYVTNTCPSVVTQFGFNTIGSTDPSNDIDDAKVYYTGTTQGFTTNTLFGALGSSPSGTFIINGGQLLTAAAGIHYFYLSYDVAAGATLGNVVDARIDSFIFGGLTKTDMKTPDPAGSRTIDADPFCVYEVSNFADYYWCQAAPYPTAYETFSWSIDEVTIGAFKEGQNNKTIIVDLPPNFQFDITGTGSVAGSIGGDIVAATFAYTSATRLTATIKTDGSAANLDKIKFDNFEIRANISGIFGNITRNGGNFKIDNQDTNPTSSESMGYMVADVAAMTYDSTNVTQASTAPIHTACPLDAGILEIKITVSNICTPLLNITQFGFNTIGSTDPSNDIDEAQVWYTGTTQGFSTFNLFGSLGSSPSGTFIINGSQTLSGSGAHYFYLSYDIAVGATATNTVDARMDSFIYNATTVTDMLTPNPAGSRTIDNDLCLRPDLPNPPANPTTIYAPSLIIPMDTANQSYAAGSIFNLKAYGLVHDLLLNDVPIRWIIRSGKSRGDTDFVAITRRVWPDTTAFASTEFRAGAFVVDSQYIDVAANGFVKTARTVINDYGKNVVVLELGANEVVDVRYNLDQRPKIAVFDNGGNDPIHVAVLDSGGVTNYFTVGAGVFTGIDSCFTFCSEPHWGGGLSDSAITNNVKKFISEGGNFLRNVKVLTPMRITQ